VTRTPASPRGMSLIQSRGFKLSLNLRDCTPLLRSGPTAKPSAMGVWGAMPIRTRVGESTILDAPPSGCPAHRGTGTLGEAEGPARTCSIVSLVRMGYAPRKGATGSRYQLEAATLYHDNARLPSPREIQSQRR